MGVTVNDLLQLPSFRGAEVLTGRNNVSRTVSSLSVLEVSDGDFCSKIVQTVQEEWYAEELVISSFYSIRNSVEKQCETIRYLHDLGELGLILYYVGIVLPDIPQEVLQLAEELDFLIICMPKNDYSLRYNEIIYEVMETIIRNQAVNDHFVKETLEKVSLLPEHLQSVEITLKLLSYMFCFTAQRYSLYFHERFQCCFFYFKAAFFLLPTLYFRMIWYVMFFR